MGRVCLLKRVYVLVFLWLLWSTPTHAQISIDRFSFNTNYNGIRIPNGFNENQDEGLAWNAGIELELSDYWSVHLYHYHDYDGYQQLRVPVWGAPLPYYDARVPWASRYTESFGMVRLYTESNYYSKSYDLRNKDLYGFYFSMGWSMQTYKGRYWTAEQFLVEFINDDGETDYKIDNYIDRSEVFVVDRSVQFGAGFKNFHSKMVYSDIMLLSSAYTRDYRTIESYVFPDSRRVINDDPLDLDQANSEALTMVWARNGRGLLLNVSIGINLDIRR